MAILTRLEGEVARLEQDLKRANTLAELGRTAAHIAHEVRNSLAPVGLYMGLLKRNLAGDSGSLGILAKIEDGFALLEATLHDLLHFAANRKPAKETVTVQNVIDSVLNSVAPRMESQHVQAAVEIPARTTVTADPELLRRAVLNLVMNALDVMPDGGELSIIAHTGQKSFELEVADSGPGLEPEHRMRVFEPFFTTKSTGTGLGLAVVRQIAEVHGGSITCLNCPQGGAAFILSFPRTAAALAKAA
jgi:signal transduction histidine kinase